MAAVPDGGLGAVHLWEMKENLDIKEFMKSNSGNCPFCEAEVKGYSSSWSGSPEFWADLERRHEEHRKKISGRLGAV